jgi:hypothetical protein
MKARLFSPSSAGRIMAAVAVGIALLACGSIAAQSDTTSQPSLALPPTTQPCEAAALRAVVDRSAVRQTTDGTYVPIDLINLSRGECVLRGYTPVTGVSTTAGHDAHAAHIAGADTPVFLGSNYAAHVWVLIAKARGGPNPGSGAAGCRQLTASGLRVGLPQTNGHVWIPYPFTACAGTNQSLLSIRPVLRGLANPTIFP